MTVVAGVVCWASARKCLLRAAQLVLCRHSASAESLSWLALSASLVQTSWRPLLTGVLVGSCRCASWHAFVPCWSCRVCLHPHLLLYRCAVVLVAASRWPPCLAAELHFCIKSAHEVPCALISQPATSHRHKTGTRCLVSTQHPSPGAASLLRLAQQQACCKHTFPPCLECICHVHMAAVPLDAPSPGVLRVCKT